MTKPDLKSSTALLVSFALIVPAPALTQTAEIPFPCISPSGEEVGDVDQLALNLLTFAQDGGVLSDAGTCLPESMDAALAIGGEELAAALSGPAPVDEAPEAEEVTIEEVEETPTAVEPEVAPEEVATEAEVVVDPAPAEEEPAEAEVEVAPIPELALEAVPEADPVVEVPEAETEKAIEPVAPEAIVETAPEAVTPEVVVEKPEVEAPATTEAPVTTEAPIEEAPVADAQVSEAGEAGGEAMSDTERQEIAQAREDAQVANAASEAEADTEMDAEVTTETISEEDVRKSDEDFDTAVTADIDAAAQGEGKDRGLSNFEKALLLGLGAAVVGTVLNNGDQVVSNSGDRVVVERDGELRVLKNDDQLLQRPGAQVQTQTFQDGSTRSVLTYEDGSQIITIRSSDGSVLRRTLVQASDGSEVVLFDDTVTKEAVDFSTLPTLESLEIQQRDLSAADNLALSAALQQALFADVGRNFSLRQIRDYKRVRALAPQVEIEAVTFASGSAAIEPTQAEALRDLAVSMREIIANRPNAVFLIEGHTDAVGRAGYNLALSDRRAETVALALTEYFAVPPQNLITQGYGETDLKVAVLSDERANRRAVVRNISSLLD